MNLTPAVTPELSPRGRRKSFFSDCRVPAETLKGKEGEGTQSAGKTVIGWGFFGAAAISIGVAKLATDLAIKHAKERIIAGQPIAAHQAVQFIITDMILETEAAEALFTTSATTPAS